MTTPGHGPPDPEPSHGSPAPDRAERDEVAELLAAYALDAVDDDERARVEALLAVDPRARAEVARFEDTAAALAAADGPVEPPAGTWAAIQARIAGAGEAPDEGVDDGSPAAVVPLGDRRAGPRPGTRPRWAWRIAGIAAAVVVLVAAAAAIVGLGRGADGRSSELVEALQAPSTRVGYLSGSAGEAKVVLTADGSGFLTTEGLAAPADGKVYQLWSGDSGTMVSLGVVEEAGISRFDAPAGSRGLALSLEERPGAAQPTLPPVATGELA